MTASVQGLQVVGEVHQAAAFAVNRMASSGKLADRFQERMVFRQFRRVDFRMAAPQVKAVERGGQRPIR